MKVSLIVAMAENRVIGRDNDLPWRIPADLKYFKAQTMGKPIIMGRKTFDSIGKPLPGRTNIVITRNPDWQADGVTVVASPDKAIDAAKAENPDEAMIIGGANIYQQMLDLADRLYITEVHKAIDGDSFFPDLDPKAWRDVSRSDVAQTDDGLAYCFVVQDRIKTDI